MFKKYPKLKRLNSSETNGILNGQCWIQEKIDGSNVSIWTEDSEVKIASRKRVLEDSFNGFKEYVANHEGIQALLKNNPNYRLYGEWLVPHTIRYNDESYNHFYMFDVTVDRGDGLEFMDIDMVYELAEKYKIKTPHLFAKINNPDESSIFKFAGSSLLGEKGEGVVIKNPKFVNEFSDSVYAKIVTDEFREKNIEVFGGNSKQSPNYWERYVANKYITTGRIKKIISKIENQTQSNLTIKDTRRVIHTTYHDMLMGEIWEIQRKVYRLNFRILQKICTKKAAALYKDILQGFNSVAYEDSNNA